MKKILLLVVFLLSAVASYIFWICTKSNTAFNTPTKAFILKTNNVGKDSILKELKNRYLVKDLQLFERVANAAGLWQNLHAGRYEFTHGMGTWAMVQMLKTGKETPVKLTIGRLRTKEELAGLIHKSYAVDSTQVMQFLNSPDSVMGFKVDTANVFTLIQPGVYSFYWNTPFKIMLEDFAERTTDFWNQSRQEKAVALGLTQQQAIILASIVEEETNKDSDRSLIASVYINRLAKNMRLEACPTIKYALKNFELNRIYEKYTLYPSPYNTYRNIGLPPGPICIPQAKVVDIVLNAPTTSYLFFVAKADFSGYHHFSDNYAEHARYAAAYQKALDVYMAKKQTNEKAGQTRLE
jgi:UPF0755 protein